MFFKYIAPKRFASLLYGVFFISNAAGYALAGSLGAIIPATGDKFQKAETLGVNLQDVLDKKVTLTAEQVALLKKNNYQWNILHLQVLKFIIYMNSSWYLLFCVELQLLF